MEEFDVLVIGGGGREYEIARQMTLSPKVRKVYVAPGNDGTAALPKTQNVPIGPTRIEDLVQFVEMNAIGLTVIGPDAAVAAGVGNALRDAGKLVFGPTNEAGRLESSKGFATDFMVRYDIPHPQSQRVHSLDEALAVIADKTPETYVLKADGLAAGKGVVLPQSADEAHEVLREMFSGESFDGAGKGGVVIQERLHGPELSAFAITDGKDFVLLPLSQDHKRLQNEDKGPNTGGMGAYAPVPKKVAGSGQLKKINEIARQTIENIGKEGTPYQGVLYIGLMLAEERGGDPVVIEYNARFGDPEAEILLPILSQSGVDVAEMLYHVASGQLSQVAIPEELPVCALTVALAASGYPQQEPRKGDEILGLEAQYPNVVVQHAGTKQENNKWLTNGGRVLFVTGFGGSIDEAAQSAYAAIGEQGIHFADMQFRTDIGYQARS
jgi:phosphoribosylamine--glycine ligase